MSSTYRYLRRRHARYRQRHRLRARPTVALAMAPVLFGLLAGAALLMFGVLGYYGDVRAGMRSPEEAIAARGGGARIYDRNGVLLYEFLDERYGHQQRVKLTQISPLIQQATIAAEDASFYTNPGINVKGLTRAAIENFRPGSGFLEGSGGSSITQQLVKQIYFTQEEREARSFDRKFREAALAIELTRTHDKDQILEWYLNEVPYGGVFLGIEAAASGYFSVPAKDVTLAQAAFLAGLPQSPSDYDPFTRLDSARARQHAVLDLMAKHGFISEEEAGWAKYEAIELHPKTPPFHAPHFVLYVGDYIKATLGEEALFHGGLEVTTTLDLELQWKANATLEAHLQTYEASTRGHNGSVVIIEPATGQVLAMVGSRDYWREDVDGEVNNALAVNSPGSTLKPFTYATAFMQGWGPEWPIVDSPITYKEVDGKTFTPRNPDGRTRGVMPLKQALGNSYNIPAFKTVQWVGVENMVATAKAMGITTLDRDLGPAVTLGGVDVKLLDMVYAYSTFANNGMMTGVPVTGELPPGNRELDPAAVLRIVNRKGETLMDVTETRSVEAIGAEYAYMITDILSNDTNRQVTYGRGSNLNIPGWRVAVKTGTSEPYEGNKLIGDTWTIGYSTDLAIGVWIGNSDNTPMVNIFSTTIAGRTWHDMMVAAHEGRTPRDFVRPPGLVEATVCVPSGLRADAGAKCPTVKGLFAEKALAKQTDNWWGGQFLGAAMPVSDRLARIPAEITGVKRALAEEYLRMYRGGYSSSPFRPNGEPTPVPGDGAGAAQAPEAQPTVAPPAPQPTAPAIPTVAPPPPTPVAPPPAPTPSG